MRDGIMAECGSENSASSSERAVRYEILHVSCGAARERLDHHTAWGRLRTFCASVIGNESVGFRIPQTIADLTNY